MHYWVCQICGESAVKYRSSGRHRSVKSGGFWINGYWGAGKIAKFREPLQTVNKNYHVGVLPVSVVIVNYNAGPCLIDCIKMVLSQAREVVLVDNASSDTSLADCLKVFSSDSRLRVIKNNDNVGFAIACNQGYAQAQYEFVLFLNPDCRLLDGTLAKLVLPFQKDENVGMVGGLLVNSDSSEQAGGRRAVPTPWRSFVRTFGLYKLSSRWPRLFFDFALHQQPLPDQPIEVEAISGACTLVQREAVEDVGLWDEGYFLHCEDLDWCMRFRQKGWKILFIPDAPVVHDKGGCSHVRPIFVEWHKHKGMVRFYKKFFRHQYPWGVMWFVIAGVWLRFFLLALHHLLKKQEN